MEATATLEDRSLLLLLLLDEGSTTVTVTVCERAPESDKDEVTDKDVEFLEYKSDGERTTEEMKDSMEPISSLPPSEVSSPSSEPGKPAGMGNMFAVLTCSYYYLML